MWKKFHIMVLTLAECQAPTKAAYHSPPQLSMREKIEQNSHGWGKDKQRSLASYFLGQNGLSLGKLVYIITKQIRVG